jgi:hypothetical protein
MTKDQYLRMVEQTGEEIDWERCPPEWQDFPESVATAMDIFNGLGDKVYPEIGFVGKDFTNIDMLYELHNIEYPNEKDWTLELLLFLENSAVDKSQKQLRAAYEKAKKK